MKSSTSFHSLDLPPVSVAYGVDLSDEGLVLVEARRGARGALRYRVVADGAFDAVAREVAGWRESVQTDLASARTVLAAAMPTRECVARWLDTPFTAPDKARKVLPSLLDIQLPFPLESCVYDFPARAETDSGTMRALAIAAQKHSVEAALDQVERATGESPAVLDYEGVALWTHSLRDASPTEPLRVVAYLGTDRVVWAVGLNGRFIGAHSARISSASVDTEEGRAAYVRDWTSRAARVLRPYVATGDAQPVAVHWTGPAAAQAALVNALEQAPPTIASGWTFHTHDNPHSFLARALAARAVLQDEPLRWNFRMGATQHPAVATWRLRAQRRMGAMGLAAGLALCAMNLAFDVAVTRQDARVQSALTARAVALSGLPAVALGQEVLLVQRERAQQAAQVQPFIEAFEPSLTVQIQKVLHLGQQAGVQLETVHVRPDQIQVHGLAADWDRCEIMARGLRDAGWEVVLDRQDAVAVEYVRFRLTAGKGAS